MRKVLVAGLLALSGAAHAQNVMPLPRTSAPSAPPATCPDPLPNATPGWYGETYPWTAKWDQMISDPPSQAFMVRGFPLRFSELPGASEWSNMQRLRLRGHYQVCVDGNYEFNLFIQAGAPTRLGHGLRCHGGLKVAGAKAFTVTDYPQERRFPHATIPFNSTRPFSGTMALNVGWVPLELSLYCAITLDAVTQENGLYNPLPSELTSTPFQLQVRGPGDFAPRALRPGEVVFLPRED